MQGDSIMEEAKTTALPFWENPVFWRELMDRMRSPKAVAAIFAVSISTSLIVLLRWPSISRVAVEGSRVSPSGSLSAVALLTQSSMEVFRPLAYGMAAAIALLVPAFPASAIVGERQRGTLALLLHSPLSPTRIYLGKFLAQSVLALILLSASLPAVAAAFLLGGLSVRNHLLPLAFIMTAMIAGLTAVGLAISACSKSVDSAIKWTYAAMVVLTLMLLLPSAFWMGATGWVGAIVNGMRGLSPLAAVQEISGHIPIGGAGFLKASGWIPIYVFSQALLVLVLSIFTIGRLRPELLEKAKSTGRVTDEQNLWVRIFRRLAYLVDPQRRKPGIPRFVNPVMVKEFRSRTFGRVHWLLRLVAACAIGSMGLTVIATSGTIAWGTERIVGAMVVLQLALLVLFGPALGASLISAEVESGGWVQLLMTPLSSLRIVFGKLLSVFLTLMLILLATVPGYWALTFIDPDTRGPLNRVMISLVVVSMEILFVSAWLGSLHRRAAVATITSYIAILTLIAGTFLVWVAQDRPFGKDFVERVLVFNPVAGALSEIRMPGFEQYRLLPEAWWVGGTVAGLALCGLILQTWRLTKPV